MILDDTLINDEQLEKLVLTDRDIFKKIWFSPGVVFRFIEQNSYGKYVTILLFLAGISSALDRASMRSSGDSMSLWAIIGAAVLFGGLFGWISYYIYAALLSWTGKWLKAEGNTKSLLRMLAYATIPSIASLILVFAQIGVFGNSIFQSYHDIDSLELPMTIFYYLTVAFEAILGIWTFVLIIAGLSEIQKLSIGRSILNALLPILVILIPIAIIAFILGDLLR